MKEDVMIRMSRVMLLACVALAGCNSQSSQQNQAREIRIVGDEQKQLHQLDAFNLAIGLKRAIYDAGYTCKRITDAGFVGIWENNDEWTAHCVYDNGTARDWAIFVGPDDSAQVRDCKDVDATKLPPCVIKQRPSGSFDPVKK
jgi:hypothetical protein